jgi:DNA-binding LacI/PurR family transcriptional regulator
VVVASSTLPPGFAKAFRDAGVPVVNSFGRYASSPEVHVVGIDNVECGRMAARELIRRGYKRCCVSWRAGISHLDAGPVSRLFMEELARHPDISVRHTVCRGLFLQCGRRKEMLAPSQGQAGAEAYFCGDDVLSIGALSAINDSGLKVPGDIGIIGLNDMEMAGWENINLTTIRQPIKQIIDSSIELIVSMLEDPERYPKPGCFPAR